MMAKAFFILESSDVVMKRMNVKPKRCSTKKMPLNAFLLTEDDMNEKRERKCGYENDLESLSGDICRYMEKGKRKTETAIMKWPTCALVVSL